MDWYEHLATLALQYGCFDNEAFLLLSKLPPKTLDPSRLWKEVPDDEKLILFLKNNPNWFDKSKDMLQVLQKVGAKVLHPLHADYPGQLQCLDKPPVFLSYLGSPCWKDFNCLSVVGSRQPSQLALQWLNENLSELLSAHDLVLVSGAARGIDQAAHGVSLRRQKPTVAFLPSGLASPYPSIFKSWIPRIEKTGGAIMSEYIATEPMYAAHFHQRNRLIAGMSRVVVIIEARRKSGTLITANVALRSGRDVAVVPGFPGDPKYGASLDLIYDGACLLRDYKDIEVLF